MKELEFSRCSSFCPQCLLRRNYVDIGTAMGQIVRLDKENIARDNQSFEWLVFSALLHGTPVWSVTLGDLFFIEMSLLRGRRNPVYAKSARL